MGLKVLEPIASIISALVSEYFSAVQARQVAKYHEDFRYAHEWENATTGVPVVKRKV